MDKATIGTFTANTLFYVPFGAVIARRRKLRSACDDFFVKRKRSRPASCRRSDGIFILLLSQHYRDEIEILPAAGFHRLAVADCVLVVLL